MNIHEGIGLGGYYESMADPREERWALEFERDEEAYTEELRKAAVDAIQVLNDAVADLDHDYPNHETHDQRLIVKKIIETLGEI